MDIKSLEGLIRDVPDFPKPGVLFKDITPVLGDPLALHTVVELIAEPFRADGIELVAGIEARGFVLATPVARSLGAGFIPLRKPGKLPSAVRSESYDLEYGTDALEVHADAVRRGQRVLVVDDVIATGGTAAAAMRLLNGLGADVVGLGLFIELGFLNGREALGDGARVHSLVSYD